MPINEKPEGIERPRAPAAPPKRMSLQTWFEYSATKPVDRQRPLIASHSFILSTSADFAKMQKFKKWASDKGHRFHPAHMYTPTTTPSHTHGTIDAFFDAIGFVYDGNVQNLE